MSKMSKDHEIAKELKQSICSNKPNFFSGQNDDLSSVVKEIIAFGSWVDIKNLANKYPDCLTIKSEEGDTMLHIACSKGRLNVLELLIEKELLDLKAINNNKDTLLHSCFKEQSANIEIIKFLINKGLDVNSKNIKGETPLHLACKYGKIEIVKLFTENGADIEAKTEDNSSTQFYACQNEDISVLELLVEKKVDLKAVNSNGDTLLHSAAHNWYGNKAIEILLKAEVETECNNNEGKYALDYAKEKGNTEVIKLLGEPEFEHIIDN